MEKQSERGNTIEREVGLKKRSAWLTTLLFVLFCSSPFALAAPVPHELRAPLLLRTLAYDRNLAERAGERLVIMVLQGESAVDANAIAEQLDSIAGQVNVAGLRVQIVRHPWSDAEELASSVEELAVSVIYVSAGLEPEISSMVPVAQAHQVTLITADGANMPNGGAIGFTVVDNRPQIVIDYQQASQCGMDLREAVLEVARVIR